MYRWTDVTVDCADPVHLAAFWQALLGGALSEPLPGWRRLEVDGRPAVNFQPVPELKLGKARLHLDLAVDDLAAASAQVVAQGGTNLNQRYDYDEGVVATMADPEGNEFCLVQHIPVPRGVTLRAATALDAPAMVALARLAYARYVPLLGMEPEPMTADYADIVRTSTAWLAERDGRLLGLVVLQDQEDHLLLLNVAVAPDVQGQGLGTRLLLLAESEAARRDRPEVRLYTHEGMTRNIELYRRHGYRETHRAGHRVFLAKGPADSLQ